MANHVHLVGRLGGDPDLRYSGAGKAITNLSVATTDGYGDNKKTNWHRVVVFGGQAEPCKEYLSKGSLVCVTGRIDYNQWEDKEGNKRYGVSIVASQVEFLSTKNGNGGDSDASKDKEAPAPDVSDDEVPF